MSTAATTATWTDEDLIDREARCYCGTTRPSTERADMFAFEYRGPGSDSALKVCLCGFLHEAHVMDPRRVDPRPRPCHFGGFRARGALKYDSFYCGCRGMD